MTPLHTSILLLGISIACFVLAKLLSLAPFQITKKPRVHITHHGWMSPEDRASVLQFHAIKGQQHQKARSGFTSNR